MLLCQTAPDFEKGIGVGRIDALIAEAPACHLYEFQDELYRSDSIARCGDVGGAIRPDQLGIEAFLGGAVEIGVGVREVESIDQRLDLWNEPVGETDEERAIREHVGHGRARWQGAQLDA